MPNGFQAAPSSPSDPQMPLSPGYVQVTENSSFVSFARRTSLARAPAGPVPRRIYFKRFGVSLVGARAEGRSEARRETPSEAVRCPFSPERWPGRKAGTAGARSPPSNPGKGLGRAGRRPHGAALWAAANSAPAFKGNSRSFQVEEEF